MTNEQRIEFAVNFAFSDPAEIRAGDWMNCREDLKAFLGQDFVEADEELLELGIFRPWPVPRDWPEPSQEVLEKIQADMRTLFQFVVGGPGRVKIELEHIIIRHRTMKVPYIQRSGTLRDCVLGLLIQLLEVQSIDSVSQCPQCKRFFYRRGKMVFCSRKCTNNAMVQRKRKRDEEGGESCRGEEGS